MIIKTDTKLSIAVSVLLLAASHISPVQAEDNYYSSQGYAQPGNAPVTQPPQNTQGYGAPVYRNPGYGQRSYGGRRDHGRDSNPWGGNGPGFSGPWDSGRGGRNMPWDSGHGGRNMPWDSGRGGRGGWMNKDRFADRWDDTLNAPSDMGEMPGGWNAPSISAPNPVDVGDEFGDASRDVPDQMRNVYDDNRRSNRNDRYR